ncbi:hypothetical protein E2542_SST31114 [Spatholobus suberectus]|nr:hypothetical protein E2542_SST31114 [Spatholobus suberectus]
MQSNLTGEQAREVGLGKGATGAKEAEGGAKDEGVGSGSTSHFDSDILDLQLQPRQCVVVDLLGAATMGGHRSARPLFPSSPLYRCDAADLLGATTCSSPHLG